MTLALVLGLLVIGAVLFIGWIWWGLSLLADFYDVKDC